MSEAVDQLRIRYRWEVLDAENQAIRKHRQKKKETKSKAERERIGKWEPERMENGETLPQIVSRSKHIILKHWSKWNEQQKTRAAILFDKFPKLLEGYSLSMKLTDSFNKKSGPDDKYIRYSMEKAMYLVDETGLAQYNTLKEKGFYNNIMGTSAVFSIFCDSIKFNKEKMEFTYYGRQRIERRSNILMRELVTAGQVKRVPRTENNPHGLLITNWRTLLNKDIEQKSKSNF